MIRSKSPFLPGTRPQTHDSPSLPAIFLRSSNNARPSIVLSLHRSLITSSLYTPCRPQAHSSQSLAHTFHHLWGVHYVRTIVALPTSRFASTKISVSLLFASLTQSTQLDQNKTTLSPAVSTLTRHVKLNPFVCHSYRKHPGVGYAHRTRFCVPPPHFSPETFPPLRRTLPRQQSAVKPCLALDGPGVPRGVR
jgi:hypothetical protein